MYTGESFDDIMLDIGFATVTVLGGKMFILFSERQLLMCIVIDIHLASVLSLRVKQKLN